MKSILTSTIMLFLLIGTATFAQESGQATYYSSNGKFVINYPETWAQVDYYTVDYFLKSSQASQQALNYEAVFALKDTVPFHEGPYFILSIDTTGALNQSEIDSMLTKLGETFGEGIKYFPTGDYLADLESHAPNWDSEKKQISIYTNITEQYKVIKRNLWVMQLYDRGITNFYFFAPDSLFSQYRSTFEQIVNSFSTENIENVIPKQQLKLADIEDTTDIDDNSNSTGLFGIPIGVLVIFIVIFASRRRRNKRKKEKKLES